MSVSEPNSKGTQIHTHSINHSLTRPRDLRQDWRGGGRLRREGGVSEWWQWGVGTGTVKMVPVLVLCYEARNCQSKELPIAQSQKKRVQEYNEAQRVCGKVCSADARAGCCWCWCWCFAGATAVGWMRLRCFGSIDSLLLARVIRLFPTRSCRGTAENTENRVAKVGLSSFLALGTSMGGGDRGKGRKQVRSDAMPVSLLPHLIPVCKDQPSLPF